MLPAVSTQPHPFQAQRYSPQDGTPSPSHDLIKGALGTLYGHLGQGDPPSTDDAVAHTRSGSDEMKTDDDTESQSDLSVSDVELSDALSTTMPPVSEVPVGDHELRVAAGASVQGVSPQGAMQIYKRYVKALENLLNRVEPRMRPLVNESIQKIQNMQMLFEGFPSLNEPGRKNLSEQIVEHLFQSQGSKVLIPACTNDHAMVAEIEYVGDSKCLVRLFNSAGGVTGYHPSHPSNPKKFSTFVEYEITNFQAADIVKLMSFREGLSNNQATQSTDVYAWLDQLDRSQKIDVQPDELSWQTPQKSGDCSLEVINTYLRDSVLRGVKRDAEKLGLGQDDQGSFAKSLYREMKASYLNQIYADYIFHHGSSPASAAFLEAVRVRADQAEIHSGFSGAGVARNGYNMVSTYKDYLRMYNQVGGLVSTVSTSGTIWYDGKPLAVAYDTNLSRDGSAVFKEINPKGEPHLFFYHLSTHSLRVVEPSNDQFTLLIQPGSDTRQKITRLDVLTAKSAKVQSHETIFHLDSSELMANTELRNYLDEKDLLRLIQETGDFYISVDHLPDGEYLVEGFVYKDGKTEVVRFEKTSDDLILDVHDPVSSKRPVQSGSSATLSSWAESMLDDFITASSPPKGRLQKIITDSVSKPYLVDEKQLSEREIQLATARRDAIVPKLGEDKFELLPYPGTSGNSGYVAHMAHDDGTFVALRAERIANTHRLQIIRETLEPSGKLTREEGELAIDGEASEETITTLCMAPTGRLNDEFHLTEGAVRTIEPGLAKGKYRVTDHQTDANGGQDRQSETLLLEGPQSQSDAQVEVNQVSLELQGATAQELAQFHLNTNGPSIQLSLVQTRSASNDGSTHQLREIHRTQQRPDGSTRTVVRSEVQGGGVRWTRQDVSADGSRLDEVTRTVGSDAYSHRTAVIQSGGVIREELIEKAGSSAVASQGGDSYSRTVRTTTPGTEGAKKIEEEIWRGSSQDAVTKGMASSYEQKHIDVSLEQGPDGIVRTRTKGQSQRWESRGTQTTTQTEQVIAHRFGCDVLESTDIQTIAPNNVAVRTLTQGGKTTQSVKMGDLYVPADKAPDTPEIEMALAAQDLANHSQMTELANARGLEVLAPLLGEAGLSQDPAQRQSQLQAKLEESTAKSMSRAYATGAFMSAGAALAVYSGITGLFALHRSIQTGNTYGAATAGTGVAAAGMQATEIGLQGATLMSSSTRALGALTRAATVAGRLSVGLGLVAMGMAVPGLIQAIQRGDTKQIVSSSVGIGGGLAAMVAGGLLGGPMGMAAGLALGVGVVAFTELWNWLYNPAKTTHGPDPLEHLSRSDRQLTLQHAQTLFNHWSELGGSLSQDRFEKLLDESSNDEIKAAAKFFLQHPALIVWMDSANGGAGDLEKRKASADGEITRSDLARFIGYVAVPESIDQTLPPPSTDARLWVAGVVDPQTHDDVIDAFGKDGEGQGSGDGISALPEYANIASGLFDERVRQLLEKRYPQEDADKISQHLDQLKKACAYLAAYPSELRYIDTYRQPGKEDGRLSSKDFSEIRKDHQARIDELMSKYPQGLPTFKDSAEANRALGNDNPALWRPGRFGEPNALQPMSSSQMLLGRFDQIDRNSDGTIDWVEMADARERALQEQRYGEYYALDHVMRHGADLFEHCGEGMDLRLRASDLALTAAREPLSMVDAGLLLPVTEANRSIAASTLLNFVKEHPAASPEQITVDELQQLSAGYWADDQGRSVAVTDAVRQAAIYFAKNPSELASFSQLHPKDSQPLLIEISLSILRQWAGSAEPSTQKIMSNWKDSASSPSAYGPMGPTKEQIQSYGDFFTKNFEHIDNAANPEQAADGIVGLVDLRAAQGRYLADQDWLGYYTMSWLLSTYADRADKNYEIHRSTLPPQTTPSEGELSVAIA
jgi:hypothetical protein